MSLHLYWTMQAWIMSIRSLHEGAVALSTFNCPCTRARRPIEDPASEPAVVISDDDEPAPRMAVAHEGTFHLAELRERF